MATLRPFAWGCGVLVVMLLAVPGCGRPAQSADAGVLDASKFRPAFASAPEDTQARVTKIMLSIGASDYAGALVELENLTNTPSLTEPQRQVAADLSRQLQKRLAEMPPPTQ